MKLTGVKPRRDSFLATTWIDFQDFHWTFRWDIKRAPATTAHVYIWGEVTRFDEY